MEQLTGKTIILTSPNWTGEIQAKIIGAVDETAFRIDHPVIDFIDADGVEQFTDEILFIPDPLDGDIMWEVVD